MVAIYTAHYTQRRIQNQYIAYSNDRGRTWTPYENNPVLDIGMEDFRDPKVFWYAPEEKWIMVVALSLEQNMHSYASRNLKQWTFRAPLVRLAMLMVSGNARACSCCR